MAGEDVQEAQARRGLAAWSAFPADRTPRPLVLLDTIPAIRAHGIFPDVETRLAFLHGAVEAGPEFPASVLEALRRQPGEHRGRPLRLTGATLARSGYETDRGPRSLPTWDVQAEGPLPAIQVLDPAVITSGQVWEPHARQRISGQRPEVILGVDGRTLTMSDTGSPQADLGPARLLESGNAVALIVSERIKQAPRGWYTLVGRTHRVTAILASPLGDRVLLDGKGGPVLVSFGGWA